MFESQGQPASTMPRGERGRVNMPNCALSFSPLSIVVGWHSSPVTVTLNAVPGCGWDGMVDSPGNFFTADPAIYTVGDGPLTFQITFQPNPSVTPRVGSIGAVSLTGDAVANIDILQLGWFRVHMPNWPPPSPRPWPSGWPWPDPSPQPRPSPGDPGNSGLPPRETWRLHACSEDPRLEAHQEVTSGGRYPGQSSDAASCLALRASDSARHSSSLASAARACSSRLRVVSSTEA